MTKSNYMNKNLTQIIVSLKKVNKIYQINNKKNIYALKNINLDIKKNDRIGIVGANGAGKTTLLKIISGITKPTTGEIYRNGKIVSLMDLEAGFNPDLTGYENIMVNALIIGISKKQVRKKINTIINYASIGPYINQPFYTYSSGMKFRLAISVALVSKADLLIIDEIITSGDINFQNKVVKSIQKLQKNRKIGTIICSHVPETLWSLADNFFLLEKGQISTIKKNAIKKMAIQRQLQWYKIFGTHKQKSMIVNTKISFGKKQNK